MRLLLVEDDLVLANGLSLALQNEGYVVDHLATGGDVVKQLTRSLIDLIILDLGLPDIDGVAVLKKLRAAKHHLPILILTARDALTDKVGALDFGADDYLSKPFEMSELLARLRAMTRRLGTSLSSQIIIGEVILDQSSHSVTVAAENIALHRREYMVLNALMESSGRVQTKEMLENRLYGWGEEVASNAIEAHISNLRKKLPEGFIKTIRGVGYTVKPEAAS